MYRTGIVTEVDGKKGLARVEFRDRDQVVSWWLNVNQPHASAGKSRVYSMPDLGAQVNCLVDAGGQEGTILGAFYSDEDRPPIEDAKHMHAALEGGLVFDYDRATGKLTLSAPGGIELVAGDCLIKLKPGEEIEVRSPKLTGGPS
ncbi:phage baseplate assembly protein V [Ancylobacter sp. A5.8]|uniref:phage baseplate assembly protein V n=1 Tax=Ancylobacter gelatini TaxID=2919920 RepID=UPI001F4DF94C|nr:phage baseplate assembly protein V [Ancylobacter gelatini]MCJ8142975.1 phage baseplate assembly protein V [Ancylobacter gelatini]